MSDTWMVLTPDKTKRVITIKEENNYEYQHFEKESCMMCYKTDCYLFGKYGTCNYFGSFQGLCLECLKHLTELLCNHIKEYPTGNMPMEFLKEWYKI